MGPRLFSRGWRPGACAIAPLVLASMGPRLFSRGGPNSQPKRPSVDCFNGPRLFSRGRDGVLEEVIDELGLQWGPRLFSRGRMPGNSGSLPIIASLNGASAF